MNETPSPDSARTERHIHLAARALTNPQTVGNGFCMLQNPEIRPEARLDINAINLAAYGFALAAAYTFPLSKEWQRMDTRWDGLEVGGMISKQRRAEGRPIIPAGARREINFQEHELQHPNENPDQVLIP